MMFFSKILKLSCSCCFSTSIETIFALSSGLPPCGVSVIRLSGKDSLNILKAFTSLNKVKPQYAYYTSIKQPNTEPHSFTGEDIVEFQTHGSSSVIQNLLSQLSQIPNCRPAYKGEFTKRAFLNNKMDLTQVEGLYDLINSYTELQGENSQKQYTGYLSELYNKWRNELKDMLTITESCIDFGEEEDIEGMNTYKQLTPKINNVIKEIQNTLSTSAIGELIRNGLNMILIGPPNVVSSIKGTTRDLIRTTINYEGIPMNIIDTAGIYSSQTNSNLNIIEEEGIKRTLNQLKSNSIDIPVLICDSKNMNINEFNEFRNLQSKPWWIVYNKIDLLNEKVDKKKIKNQFKEWNVYDIFPLSSKTGEGLNQFKFSLKNFIKSNLSLSSSVSYDDVNKNDTNVFITEERHKYHLKQCINNLEECLNNINNIELCSYNLKECMNCIGRIIGIIDTEEILDNIFNKFCIGK